MRQTGNAMPSFVSSFPPGDFALLVPGYGCGGSLTPLNHSYLQQNESEIALIQRSSPETIKDESELSKNEAAPVSCPRWDLDK